MRVSFQGPGRPDKGRHTQFTIRVSAFLALTLLEELLKENKGKQTKKMSCNDLLNTLLLEGLKARGVSLENEESPPKENPNLPLEASKPSFTTNKKTEISPLWEEAKPKIRSIVGEESFHTWIMPLEVTELSPSCLQILCADPFSRDTLTECFQGVFEQVLTEQESKPITVKISVKQSPELPRSMPIEPPKKPPPKHSQTQELIHRLEVARQAAGGYLSYRAQDALCAGFQKEIWEKKGKPPQRISKAEFISCLREALLRLPEKKSIE